MAKQTLDKIGQPLAVGDVIVFSPVGTKTMIIGTVEKLNAKSIKARQIGNSTFVGRSFTSNVIKLEKNMYMTKYLLDHITST